VDDPQAREQRELRHRLESFHGVEHPEAVETAWPYLASEDRILRYSARVAVEHQPVESWAARALAEERPQAKITALVALAREGTPDHRHDIYRVIDGHEFCRPRSRQTAWIFACDWR
jgi:hypothetical protein